MRRDNFDFGWEYPACVLVYKQYPEQMVYCKILDSPKLGAHPRVANVYELLYEAYNKNSFATCHF